MDLLQFMDLVQREFFGSGSAGVQTPQVNRYVSAHRHDGLFLSRTAGLGTGQQRITSFDWLIIGLKAHPAPGQFDQRRAQAPVAVLGNRAALLLIAAGPHTGTHAGEAGDLAAILESIPTEDLSLLWEVVK